MDVLVDTGVGAVNADLRLDSLPQGSSVLNIFQGIGSGPPSLCRTLHEVTWLLMSTTCTRHLHSDTDTKEVVAAAQPRHSGICEELSIWSSVWGMEKSGGDGKAVGRALC